MGAGLRQACIGGPASFYDCQRSGSGKRAQGVSAHPTPERDRRTIGVLSRKKWGSLGGKGPMEPGRPLGRRSIRARPPERVFGYFLHEQKVPRRRPRLASVGRKGPGP